MTALQRLGRLLLTDDRQQRIRLAQSGLASVLMAFCTASLHVGAALGVVESGPALTAWTVVAVSGFLLVGATIRSGVSQRLRDPSMTLFQMVYSIACAAWGYAISGAAHAITPMMLAVILMFGMFGMTMRQVLWMAGYATTLFGAVMAWKARTDPAHFDARTDLLLFLVMLAMLAGVVILTKRLHEMRDRLKDRSTELKQAVARIERLATHDDLTGLVNRRHMQELLEDERARSQRDRQAWCVALIDVDHFKRINDLHGHACGDEVLRALGQRVAALIRRTDTLGRWGGEEFVLLLPHTPVAAARPSIDRVREHFHQHALEIGALSLSLSFSAGVTQHRFGESVAQTLERADQLAYRAKQLGRNQVVAG